MLSQHIAVFYHNFCADGLVAELPEPWRTDFVPTLPVPQGHDSSTTGVAAAETNSPCHQFTAACGSVVLCCHVVLNHSNPARRNSDQQLAVWLTAEALTLSVCICCCPVQPSHG